MKLMSYLYFCHRKTCMNLINVSFWYIIFYLLKLLPHSLILYVSIGIFIIIIIIIIIITFIFYSLAIAHLLVLPPTVPYVIHPS